MVTGAGRPAKILPVKKVQCTKFPGGLIYQIFELSGPPRPNKDSPSPCQYIPMQWTEQVSIIFEYMGMMLDCPFGLGGPISSKI